MGVAAAYANKLRTGLGQRVDTSLFEAGIVQTYWQSAIALATGTSPGPMGSAHPLNAPYQAFQTADGWINIGAANQTNWEKFVRLIDSDHLGIDPRFSSNADRMRHRLELEGELNGILRQRKTSEWLATFEEGGLPAGPVLSITEMHEDPQTVARNMVPSVEHPVAGSVKTIGLPVKFSGSPGGVFRPAPLLGQHTVEILAGIGYAGDEIEAMLKSGAAVQYQLEGHDA